MKIALLQSQILFKEKEKNFLFFQQEFEHLPADVDLIVLPEMFTTGFCPQNKELAEPVDGNIFTLLRTMADKKNIAIVGSLMCSEKNILYNRGFFIKPHEEVIFIDKAHLYAHGGEDKCFARGEKRTIVQYRGAKFRLVICYDLRFPLWCRNQKEDLYDFLLVIANWPDIRIKYWDILVRARAIENQAFVVGVNMVGDDLQNLHYSGHSVALNTYLDNTANFKENEVGCRIVDFDIETLHHFRASLPLWKDMDDFSIIHHN